MTTFSEGLVDTTIPGWEDELRDILSGASRTGEDVRRAAEGASPFLSAFFNKWLDYSPDKEDERYPDLGKSLFNKWDDPTKPPPPSGKNKNVYATLSRKVGDNPSGGWEFPLSPRYQANPAEEPYGGFPKVFRRLKTGGYGYGWPTSVEEHSRFRGTIPGTDISYGPPRQKSDADRAEVNEAAMKRRKYLLERRNFWIRTGNMNMVKQIDAQLKNIQY